MIRVTLQDALDDIEGKGYRIQHTGCYGIRAIGQSRPYNLALGATVEEALIEVAYRHYLSQKYPLTISGRPAA